MAMQQMAHPDGELAVSRACKACGACMIVSTMANYGIGAVAEAAGPEHLWFQLYVSRYVCMSIGRCGRAAKVSNTISRVLG
jgi:isopentenyl diphosphate isomerase/L-lactate dehydrogenase-like FMN-dependent dehydrogenase